MQRPHGKLDVSGTAAQPQTDEVMVSDAVPDAKTLNEDAVEASETGSIYSDISAVSESRMQYLNEFVGELVTIIQPYQRHKLAVQKVSEALPELLRTFALSLGHAQSTPMQRETMVLIHKYRRYVKFQVDPHRFYASANQRNLVLLQGHRASFRKTRSR